ncbi:MAG: hypothetical protein ABIP94_00210, partial [Planctomycetota bacterium]
AMVAHSARRRTDTPPPATLAKERAALAPLVWLAGMSVTMAFVREALSFWSPLLLVESCALPAATAVRASALLPLASGLGALLAGLRADRGLRSLAAVTLVPLLVAGIGLGLLAAHELGASGTLLLLAVVSCCTAMPQSLVSGVLPLRTGASGGATRLGFVDGMGTMGAVFAAGGVARVREAWGMPIALAALACTIALAALATLGFLVTSRRAHRFASRTLAGEPASSTASE